LFWGIRNICYPQLLAARDRFVVRSLMVYNSTWLFCKKCTFILNIHYEEH
jgi:hypothetical protein